MYAYSCPGCGSTRVIRACPGRTP
ncbi:hypothetical protein DCW30_34310 [Streptomyces alfalfae]|uniref:Uncharacterized protein n=1 Tax=Streptomyces alfalfae TaxID=1642299 RepID=A0A4Q2G737_9ACTN|nr:hypothetical protein D3X13_02035 [Streptomyces fradiae]QQC93820.1 hypothetical protein I8755_16810 [Streptomyces alfalfae]THC47881.1 hypothetical protein E7X58_26365 [Streptomyces sp. A1499]QUI35894.1 hypothetical protein H9W91_16435 [Streptomyces alfalfae]RXX35347.1 hypothetical protein DCW30_34310 [Streptomyces alfalfae]